MTKAENSYIRELISIAKDLHYDEDIINNIRNAKSIRQAENWLTTARQRLSNKDIEEIRIKNKSSLL